MKQLEAMDVEELFLKKKERKCPSVFWVKKNPMYGRCGATNPNSRLTDEEVKMIYVYLNSQYNGEYTQQGIADYFGVSRDTIKRIRSLEQHKYLKDFDLQSEEAKLLLDNFLEIFKGQPQAKSKCNRLRKV